MLDQKYEAVLYVLTESTMQHYGYRSTWKYYLKYPKLQHGF